ncbi:MAG: NUDIX domain-containing protein [Candidatus Omnitrophica bacterium]|nr:NUDIX domain-containing protein [Candidatus Omnitrophota bacterium]
MKRELDVVAAFITQAGKALLCQRKEDDAFANLWEFPGGKIEEKESHASALKREIKEELALDIEVGPLVEVFEDEIPALKIKVYLYKALRLKGEIKCLECKDFGFFGLDEIRRLKLAPVDKKIADYLEGLENKPL